MPVRLQLRDKARGKYGLCNRALNDIMCSCLWSEYLRAMKLSKTWSLTMLNGNEIDMALSFIPLLRFFFFFFWSQGWFCRASSLAGLSRSSPARAAEGILSMLMREKEFEICLQFTLSFWLRSDCFVCLFLILAAGNSYGEMDYRILGYISGRSSLYLCHSLWLHRRCILGLSFQNSLSARQWCHHFNILDIYYLLTFTVVQPASWRGWEGIDVSGMLCLKYQKKNTVLSFWIISSKSAFKKGSMNLGFFLTCS